MSLGKPRNGLRRGLGHLSYIWWVSRIQIFKFSNVTVTFSRNNGYKTVTFFKNFEKKFSKKIFFFFFFFEYVILDISKRVHLGVKRSNSF